MVHRPIRLVGSFGIDIEAVAVLHDKFLRTHQTKTRARLVAELRLDLIDVKRQLTIGRNDVRHKVGNFLLGRWPHSHIALCTILETEHIRAHRVPTASRAPKLGGLQCRHENLARASRVHLLAHDLLNLLEHTHPERHECKKPCGSLPADACPHEQFMRIDFGILRIVTQGLNKRLCPFHGVIIPNSAYLRIIAKG